MLLNLNFLSSSLCLSLFWWTKLVLFPLLLVYLFFQLICTPREPWSMGVSVKCEATYDQSISMGRACILHNIQIIPARENLVGKINFTTFKMIVLWNKERRRERRRPRNKNKETQEARVKINILESISSNEYIHAHKKHNVSHGRAARESNWKHHKSNK